MFGARVLLGLVGPLRLALWVLAGGAVVIAVLTAIGVARHLETVRDARRREHVRIELEPVFSRFLETEDSGGLAEQLRPAFLHMDKAHRPVAALLAIDVMREASPDQRERLRHGLEESGIVELGERGTRRFSPWRRALACEALGKMGAKRSVPALIARLADRRPEVRIAAVRALGEMRAEEAVPALSNMFLERRGAPIDIVNKALRKIGSEAAPAFERGIASNDPVVRVSSCFGLSGLGGAYGTAAYSLAQVLASDPEPRVRAAAAGALGIVGGGNAPAELISATTDPDVNVRRNAVKALASFDDPATGEKLDECTEDDDRETAIRAAEALVALARQPRAGPAAQARLESSSAWAVAYSRTVAQVTAEASA
jgi:hypothetical protein